MIKVRFKAKAGKRRNPVAMQARRCKGGPHRNRRKDALAHENWVKEMTDSVPSVWREKT